MTMFAQPKLLEEPAEAGEPKAAPAKRPSRWSPSNWSVRWKVFAIVLIPTALAVAFGGMRIYNSVNQASDLRLAADRAEMVQPIERYMSGLNDALLANSTGTDVSSARSTFDQGMSALQRQTASTNVAPDIRSGITTLLNAGPGLLDKVQSDSIPLRDEVTTYAPILMTAQEAIDGSVRIDDQKIRAEAQGLSRAVGARGQMLMQQLLVNKGGDLPEPELRTSMITLAGTEPSTLFGMSQVLGVGSPDVQKLQQEMVGRMATMSDPSAVLAGNPQLLQSLQSTDQIASRIINDTTASVTKAVDDRANSARTAAIRDAAIIAAAIIVGLVLVLLVARSLVRPLRRLRAGALKAAHEDLPAEIEQVRAGQELPSVEPIPVHTSEEVGQVAHAVDELHEQALMMAGEQARLQMQVSDMFETLSRRSRSLVDQQLSLIDSLERDEDDPQRLDSLFKLDHLAARMRRNGTNLLVLAGAKLRREQAEPVPVASVINAAASQVEDYRRVVTATVPHSSLVGSAAGDVVHLLAELIDNALRYSPPSSPVRISAVHTGNRGLVIEVSDMGLGMTEGDLRMANMRLESGGEVTPYTARHMGLFVVGRLAAQHGLVVRLRSSVVGEPRSGTTAGIFVPAELISETAGPSWPDREDLGEDSTPEARSGAATARALDDLPGVAATMHSDAGLFGEPYRNGSSQEDASLSSLPRRDPGASGILGTPEPAAGEHEAQQPEEAAETRAPADTSAFFTARSQPANGAPPAEAGSADDTDVIFQRLVSEWLIDPETLMEPLQSWESVWDSGWAAAEHAEQAPVNAHTDQGLPMREPGARLVPGRPNGAAHRKPDDDNGVASAAGESVRRDPDAVRASLSNHWGGVRAARSHARENGPEMDSQ
ncbi:sensor histidine kinase [Mycobacterium sp.]|uniref:sensor histidine kinase n=1 Tax=Mycobacterium sp. TaxID=1785 RepID=UPI002B6F26E0|nr:ATP-binding protein [Mycobacterium sp.]HME48037.1 ATP-binding protein [Mycobacterium sp.]